MPLSSNVTNIAIALEKVIQDVPWTNLAAKSHPLVARIVAQGRVGEGFGIREAGIGGLEAIGPFSAAEGVVEGKTQAELYSAPLSLAQISNDALKMWSYPFTMYVGGFLLDRRQRSIIEKGLRPGVGMDFMDLQKRMMVTKYTNLIQSHIGGNGAAADNALIGLYYVLPDDPTLSTNNVGAVGAYNSLTGNLANWRPITRNLAGAQVGLATLLQMQNEGSFDVVDQVQDGPKEIDLILLPENSTQRIYSTIANAFGNIQRFAQSADMARYGFGSLELPGGTSIVRDKSVRPSGEEEAVIGLNTGYWFFGGDFMPTADTELRQDGKAVHEYLYVWEHTFGCANPGRQVKYYGGIA